MISSKRNFTRSDYFFAREQSPRMRAARWARKSFWEWVKEWLA